MVECPDERWQVGDLIIDVGQMVVMRDDQPIPLPQLSFQFLLALVRSAPRVLSTDNMMEQVWSGVFVNNETVTQRAKLLRDALGDDPKAPRYFSVRRSAGYQLIPNPVRLDDVATHRNRARRHVAILAAVLLAVVALGGIAAMNFWSDRPNAMRGASIRVAVLPFENLSSDPADAYIARSIPEMVLNRLSSVRGLTLISRESALMSEASNSPAIEAGRKLGAEYVVKGSVQHVGGTLRVTCFVVDTDEGSHLWSERFDWPTDRLYALQDRIADRVTSVFQPKLRGMGELAAVPPPTKNTDAYLAYLKGKSLLGRFTVAETDAAAVQFQKAVELDPTFGDAMVALFDARMQGADLRKDDLESPRARYGPMLDKALKLNPDSGPALFAKAMWSGLPISERLATYRRAAKLDPSNSRGLTAFAEFLDRASNTHDGVASNEARRLIDRVLMIDPLSPRALDWSIIRNVSGKLPNQIEEAEAKALALDPNNYIIAIRYAVRRWMFHGETAEAIGLAERAIATDPQNPGGVQMATAFYLDANDPTTARAVAMTTPATRDSSQILLSQYSGDWDTAGRTALGPRGFLFNKLSSFNWAEAVRDYSLRTGNFKRGAEAIATHYGFDLRNPRTRSLQQATAAVALGHILISWGRKDEGTRLLASTIQWIDAHPHMGMVGVLRIRATALMLLGEQNQALSDLSASVKTGHDIRFWWYVVDRDPVWAPVRDDPRFKAITNACRSAAHAQRAKLDAMRRDGTVPARTAGKRT